MQLLSNRTHHLIGVINDIIISKTYKCYAIFANMFFPPLIIFLCPIGKVNVSIDLYCQLYLNTIEIDNEAINAILSSDLKSVNLPVS